MLKTSYAFYTNMSKQIGKGFKFESLEHLEITNVFNASRMIKLLFENCDATKNLKVLKLNFVNFYTAFPSHLKLCDKLEVFEFIPEHSSYAHFFYFFIFLFFYFFIFIFFIFYSYFFFFFFLLLFLFFFTFISG